jgi:hypothetical protein
MHGRIYGAERAERETDRRTYQPLPVPLQALRVELLHGDLRRPVDQPEVDDAEAALADDLSRVEVARGLPELVVREQLQVPVPRHGPELLHVPGNGQRPLRRHLAKLRRDGRRRPPRRRRRLV